MVRDKGINSTPKKLTDATIWYLCFVLSWEFNSRDRLFSIALGKSKTLEVLQSIRAKKKTILRN